MKNIKLYKHLDQNEGNFQPEHLYSKILEKKPEIFHLQGLYLTYLRLPFILRNGTSWRCCWQFDYKQPRW